MSGYTFKIAHATPFNPMDDELKTIIESIYNIRDSVMISGDTLLLNDCFDTSKESGKRLLEHEIKRTKYLKIWSKAREIQFKNIESIVRIKKVTPLENKIKVNLEETYKFDYIYEKDQDAVNNCFGVGIRHTVYLTPKNESWIISNDLYTDSFEDALQVNPAREEIHRNLNLLNLFPPIREIIKSHSLSKSQYNREKAISYADKYCGAAWGSGNNYKYNSKYADFNGRGGDCTNFVSQILGDNEGGGLDYDKKWYSSNSKFGRSIGSYAWSNADGLKNYLINSGRGTIIKAGNFKELTSPTSDFPKGAVNKLLAGDLICYEKGRGNIDHFAVVTGFDSQGYPLVNSHTTDRYHVPWDLGWGDKRIRFYLIQIK